MSWRQGVAAGLSWWSARLQRPDSPMKFEAVYYPKAGDRGSAAVISLTPGQEFEANLKVNLRVRGTLRNLAPYQPVRVELLRGPNEVSSN